MTEQKQDQKVEKPKGFFGRLLDKLDANLEKKAKGSCCCKSSDKEKDSSCC